MKVIISIAIGLAIWFAIGSFTYEITRSRELAWVVGILFGATAIYISFKKLVSTSFKESIANGVAYIKTATEDISSLIDDKDSKFYATAEQEIKDTIIDNGLWSQALVKAKGDENLRKVEYMKLRVKQLKKDI
ncbi:MAG: hypothetical protein M0P91_07840 [Sulfuricurvum sp.]|jgi:hypothetical protein|uniref:hypothetical protein n=1 Tax=Sulfuricurvum sp. TaxID=2025608 RepID=UPI0025F92770|nr:hypothetical protein [Sulfuricurvum sp.]MCK9373095.1 hypothetical protein [Sulfuricurvum sp.]